MLQILHGAQSTQPSSNQAPFNTTLTENQCQEWIPIQKWKGRGGEGEVEETW